MHSLNLCRERLERLLRVLDRHGTSSVRSLLRSHGLQTWEVEQAVELGWVTIDWQKPPVGRPKRVVRRLSETASAKLPQPRRQGDHPISSRHWKFAMLSVGSCVPRGSRIFSVPGNIDAYVRAFPKARVRSGAHASCSRLLRHPDVIAARHWLGAQINREIPDAPLPHTAHEIRACLIRFGSWRAWQLP